jgi:hypothetical protein
MYSNKDKVSLYRRNEYSVPGTMGRFLRISDLFSYCSLLLFVVPYKEEYQPVE